MKVLADKTWCLTDKGERVPEGHPLARFLLVNKGSEIEQSELDARPLLEEKPESKPQKIEIQIDEPPPEPEPEPPPPPKPKRAPKPKSKSPPPLQAVTTKTSRPRPPGTPPMKSGKRK